MKIFKNLLTITAWGMFVFTTSFLVMPGFAGSNLGELIGMADMLPHPVGCADFSNNEKQCKKQACKELYDHDGNDQTAKVNVFFTCTYKAGGTGTGGSGNTDPSCSCLAEKGKLLDGKIQVAG